MSFADRIRAWLKGETKKSSPTRDLEEFIQSRTGVEGFLEPKTAIYSTTLLLVAADGEYLRRPVRDRAQAATVCEKAGVPLYDAAKVGYPKRMRDYDRGIRRDTVDLEDLPPWPGNDEPGKDAAG